MLRKLSGRLAITLVESLIVVSVTGILLSLIVPAVQQIRAAAARSACQNSLRQVAIALHSHEATFGLAPMIQPGLPGSARAFDQSMSWYTLILPELGYDAVFLSAKEAHALTDRLSADPPHSCQRTVIAPFRCQADTRLSGMLTDTSGVAASFTSFVGVLGNLNNLGGKFVTNGVMAQNGLAVRISDIRDGASQTLMVGERPPDDGLLAGWWYRFHPPPVGGPDIVMLTEELAAIGSSDCRQTGPNSSNTIYHFGPGLTSNPCDRFHFWSLHPGGANFAFADGSVRTLAYSAAGIMQGLGSRDGGEVMQLPD